MSFKNFVTPQKTSRDFQKSSKSLHFIDAVRIPSIVEDSRGLPLVLLPFEYRALDTNNMELGFHFYEHSIRRAKEWFGNFLCTARHEESYCHLCNIAKADDGKFLNSVSKATGLTITKVHKVAFPVFVLRNFHTVPQKDESGKIRTNKDGEPYTKTVMCTDKPDTCENCRSGYPKFFGKQQYLPVTIHVNANGEVSGQMRDLYDIDSAIERICACGGDIDPTNGQCTGTINERGERVPCSDPRPLTIVPLPIRTPLGSYKTPIVLWLGKQGTGTKTSLIRVKHLPINLYFLNDGGTRNPLAKFDPVKKLWLWHPIIGKALTTPIDLPKILDPSLTDPTPGLISQDQFLKEKLPPNLYQEFQKFSAQLSARVMAERGVGFTNEPQPEEYGEYDNFEQEFDYPDNGEEH